MTDETASTVNADEPRTGVVEKWELDLYVAGGTIKSLRAIADLEQLCQDNLAGHYRIEVIDLEIHPEVAIENDITAVPTLVRRSPFPSRRVCGDLSNAEAVLKALDITSALP